MFVESSKQHDVKSFSELACGINLCFVSNIIICLGQLNAIKERVKGISTLEREITKYVDDGKDDYKEVKCFGLMYSICFPTRQRITVMELT